MKGIPFQVLARFETLSEEAQRQVKAVLPFETLQRLQPQDRVRTTDFLGGALKREYPWHYFNMDVDYLVYFITSHILNENGVL